jgi:dihydroflavonol-4-reductase
MILVTGATGLLGSHVVCDLLAHGYAVRALYRSEERKEVVRRLLQYYVPEKAEAFYASIDWFQGDILDLIDLEDAMEGCEKVVHCAALVSFHRRDFWHLFAQNRKGTANVVNTALHVGIKQLVYVSSTAAIGSDSKHHDSIRRESNHWNANEKVSGYSLSKYSAEKEVWRGIEEGLPSAIVNPSLLFGPGNWDESSLKILRTLQNGLRYYTPGGNAFVDVRDVAYIIRRLLEENVSGERYLVTGQSMSFKDFFGKVCAQLNVKAPSVEAGPFLTGFAWRLAGIWARFARKRPTITKESAGSSHKTTVYSNEKVLKRFPEFEFRSLEDTIGNTIRGKMD